MLLRTIEYDAQNRVERDASNIREEWSGIMCNASMCIEFESLYLEVIQCECD